MTWVLRLRTALSQPYWRLRRRVLRAAFAARRPDRVRMPNGRTLYLDRADARSFALWETSGNVNRRSMALWQALLRLHPWSLILDVGANHGEMLLWPDLPCARVYAFEPNPALAPLLRRSLAESRIAAEVVEAAVGAADGHIALHLDRRWSGTSSLIAANTSGDYRTVDVPITRLDSFLAGLDGPAPGGSLLVKIDVEGLEAEVLQGLRPALSRWDRVAIMAEVHRLTPDVLDGVASDFDVLALNDAGALQLLPPPMQEGGGMDVLLMPKGDAARYGFGPCAAALTADSCPA
jgi:FkbM family methyltransferase